MLLVPAAVVVLAAFSFRTKFDKVMKSAPMNLKMASFNAPAVPAGDGAVMVLPLPVIVTWFTAEAPERLAVMAYPPAGFVCGLPGSSVMVTGPDMAVCVFNAVIASASVKYDAANPGVVLPGLVTVTCAEMVPAKKDKKVTIVANNR